MRGLLPVSHSVGGGLEHYRDGGGLAGPHLKGCRALVYQHLDAAQHSGAGAGGLAQQGGFGRIIH